MVKFVSYDGKFPRYCSGVLTIEVNNVECSLPKYSLISGGNVGFDANGDEVVKHGAWRIDESQIPEDLRIYKDEILECINANLRPGCCGGCI